jgi:hypothetical protein
MKTFIIISENMFALIEQNKNIYSHLFIKIIKQIEQIEQIKQIIS